MRRSITLKAFLLLFVMSVVGVATMRNVYAATGQLYVSPGSTSVQNGANFTVNVRINPGTAVNAIQYTLGWDSSKIKYISIDASQSPFTTSLGQSVTASSITAYRGIGLGDSSISSDSLLATITFQALTGSGTGSLALTNANAAAPDGSYTNPSVGNGAVTFTTPATPPPTTGGTGGTGGTSGGTSSGTSSGGTKPASGGTGSTTTGTSGGATTPAADTTPPKLETVQTVDNKLQFKSAQISLTTSEPTQVYVKYGLGDQLNLQTTLSELSKTHTIDLTTVGLLPGTSYSYQVIAKDTSGNETQSPVKTFKTKGYTLRVTVLGVDNQPLRKVQVVLHSDTMTAKTDGDGVVQFQDVAPGSHHVTYTSKGKEYSQAIAVDDNVVTNPANGAQTAALQSVAVQFAVKSGGSVPALLPVVLLVVIAAAVAMFFFRGKFGNRLHMQPAAAMVNQPSVTAPANDQLVPLTGPTGPATIEHAHGLDTPSPGSVVVPHDNTKQDA